MMRRLTAGSAGLLLVLAACTGPDDGEEPPPTPETTTPSPTEGTDDDVDQDDGDEDADDTASDEGADGDGDGTEDDAGEAARTDVPPDAMLSAEALGGAEPRDEDDAVVAWRLPEACGVATPAAESMRTVVQGTGELEQQVSVQQTAAFADADAAIAAADELAAALQDCKNADESSAYYAEEIEIGAQGHGLITDFYGEIESPDEVGAIMGTYLAITRHGSAITLLSIEGGEGLADTARIEVLDRTAVAWDLLCDYAEAGC